MIPNHNQIRFVLLHTFTKNKTVTKNQGVEILSEIFNISEKDLQKRTRKGKDYSFANIVKWQFTMLEKLGFVKKRGTRYSITFTGLNVSKLLQTPPRNKK